jgi:hypothetical protein
MFLLLWLLKLFQGRGRYRYRLLNPDKAMPFIFEVIFKSASDSWSNSDPDLDAEIIAAWHTIDNPPSHLLP